MLEFKTITKRWSRSKTLCYTLNMNKKLILIVAVIIGLIIIGINFSSNSPVTQPGEVKNINPSETLKEYFDPSGFTMSYPDNLSLTKNDVTDENTYADIQLNSKDVSGSLNLKITDSKFATLDEWLKLNKGVTKEVTLGNLKGMEIMTTDRLLLGALDKGIFFTIEMPLMEKDFWMTVYDQVLTTFSFSAPESVNSVNSSSEDVSFEGEEVVE